MYWGCMGSSDGGWCGCTWGAWAVVSDRGWCGCTGDAWAVVSDRGWCGCTWGAWAVVMGVGVGVLGVHGQ